MIPSERKSLFHVFPPRIKRLPHSASSSLNGSPIFGVTSRNFLFLLASTTRLNGSSQGWLAMGKPADMREHHGFARALGGTDGFSRCHVDKWPAGVVLSAIDGNKIETVKDAGDVSEAVTVTRVSAQKSDAAGSPAQNLPTGSCSW